MPHKYDDLVLAEIQLKCDNWWAYQPAPGVYNEITSTNKGYPLNSKDISKINTNRDSTTTSITDATTSTIGGTTSSNDSYMVITNLFLTVIVLGGLYYLFKKLRSVTSTNNTMTKPYTNINYTTEYTQLNSYETHEDFIITTNTAHVTDNDDSNNNVSKSGYQVMNDNI